jgi:SNF2 family DNA or RNA helicase
MIRISEKQQKIVMPYEYKVAAIIPHVETVMKNDNIYMLIPHRPTETKLLQNLGYDVPSPAMSGYDWCGTTPYKHQRATASMLIENRRAYVLSGMGSGKTRAALYAFDYLKKQGEVHSALIVAPLSTLTTVWEKEIFQCFPHLTVSVLHGTREKRQKALEVKADVYVINHDGVHILQAQLRDRIDIDLILLDEAASFRNARTRRWKAMNEVMKFKRWAWGMTGSPTPQAPTDAWAQCRLFTPDNVPRFFKRFQDETMYQINQFKWVPRENAHEIVHKAMQPSVRFATEDCIDLPPLSYSQREVGLSTEQTKAYKELSAQMYSQWEDKEITAANAGVALSKLLQICAGSVYSNDGQTITLPAPERLKAVKEVIEETDRKVIVFAPFIHTVKMLNRELSKDYAVEMIYGDTPKGERDRIFNEFQNSPNPRVLVAHPQTMAHGLTLTAANIICWYSPPTSLEIYEQANARITRPSQTAKQLIVQLESSAVERRVYKRLDQKGKVQSVLLDMFREETSLLAGV